MLLLWTDLSGLTHAAALHTPLPPRQPLSIFLSLWEVPACPAEFTDPCDGQEVLAVKLREKADLGCKTEKEFMKFNQMPKGNT